MVVYGSQEIISDVAGEYFIDSLKDYAVSGIDNYMTNNIARK